MLVKNFMITGPPGSGKTSLLFEVVDTLRENFVVGGVYCPEMREAGRRVGFAIVDLKTGRRGILALKDAPFTGPKLRRYVINLDDLDMIGTRAIKSAIQDESDVIVIDEIGLMELKSKNFEIAVFDALNSRKPVVGVIHIRTDIPALRKIRMRKDTKIYRIDRSTSENQRKLIANEIIERVTQLATKYKRNRNRDKEL